MQQKRKEAKEMQEIENLKEQNLKPQWKPRLPQVAIKKESTPQMSIAEEKKEVIEEVLLTENNENQNPLIEPEETQKQESQKSIKGLMNKIKKVWK